LVADPLGDAIGKHRHDAIQHADVHHANRRPGEREKALVPVDGHRAAIRVVADRDVHRRLLVSEPHVELYPQWI